MRHMLLIWMLGLLLAGAGCNSSEAPATTKPKGRPALPKPSSTKGPTHLPSGPT
jgi:hypothetical protein